MESFKKMVTRKVSNMNLKLQLNQLKSRNIGTLVEANATLSLDCRISRGRVFQLNGVRFVREGEC